MCVCVSVGEVGDTFTHTCTHTYTPAAARAEDEVLGRRGERQCRGCLCLQALAAAQRPTQAPPPSARQPTPQPQRTPATAHAVRVREGRGVCVLRAQRHTEQRQACSASRVPRKNKKKPTKKLAKTKNIITLLCRCTHTHTHTHTHIHTHTHTRTHLCRSGLGGDDTKVVIEQLLSTVWHWCK